MRSSSIKTLAVAVTIALSTAVVAPAATAAPRGASSVRQASHSKERDGVFRMIERIIKRAFNVSLQSLPIPPIPQGQ